MRKTFFETCLSSMRVLLRGWVFLELRSMLGCEEDVD